MPIYRGTGGSTPLNDNVTEDEVGLLLSRFDTLASELERQTGVVATDLAQAVTAANQAVADATQQKLFAQAAAQEASGYAVDAFFARDAAQLSETNAATSAAEAAASAASVDAANLARIDQSNTFTGPQVVIPDPSDPTNDALLSLVADPNNTVDAANPVLKLTQDGGLAEFHLTMSSGTDGVLRTVNDSTVGFYNDILFQQVDRNGTARTPLRLDSDQKAVFGGDIVPNTGVITTESDSTPLSLTGQEFLVNTTGLFTSSAQSAFKLQTSGGNARAFHVVNDTTDIFSVDMSGNLSSKGIIEARDDEPGANVAVQARNTSGGGDSTASLNLQTVNATWQLQASRNGYVDLKAGSVTFQRSYTSGQYTVLGAGADVADRTLAGSGGVVVAGNTHIVGDLSVDGQIAGVPQEETGTWTPRFLDIGGGEVGAGIVQRTGEYVKVGTQVTVYFRYNTTSSVAANRTIERLTGLPFPVKDTVDNFAAGSVQTVDIQFGDSDPHLLAFNNTSTALFRYNRTNAASTLPTAPSDGGAFTIRGSLTYQTN